MLERPSAWDDPSFPTENGDGESEEEDCLPAVVTIHLYRNGDMTLVMADVHIPITSRGLEQLVRSLMTKRVLFVRIVRVRDQNSKAASE